MKAPSFIYASLRVFDLSIGEMLWSRRSVFMALLVAVPIVIAGFVRVYFALGGSQLVVENVPVRGPEILGLLMWLLFVRFIVPALGVFYGTALVADEVEDKTITYLFSRPIPRGAILVGKYVAYLVCTVFVVLPSITLVWLLVIPTGGSLGASFPDLVADLGVLALGLAAYGALFALVGAVFKRPLLTGLIYIIGWEFVVMLVPGYLKRLTIAYYVEGLVPHAMPSTSPASLLLQIFRETPSLSTSLLVLAALIGVSLFLAARAVSRREYVLEQ